jgi:glycosyltransferase involved in cell wall biosynthesis
MIYVCAHVSNHATTVGLLLWKIRQVFTAFPREYHLLVVDDGSSDTTREVLDLYQRALPLSVLRAEPARGYAASLEVVLREALRRTDRPKRDCAVTIRPDFSVPADALADFVRRIESGADLVVGEELDGRRPVGRWLVRRSAPWLLRPGVRVPGLRDFMSGCFAVRLSTLRQCLKERSALLDTDGWAANAELIARAASEARQIAAIRVPPGPRPTGPAIGGAVALALSLYRTGRRVHIPTPAVPIDRAW